LIERGLNLEPQQLDRHPLTCLKAELLLDMGDVESSMAVYRQAEQNAEDDKQLCDAWMGLAAYMRIKTHYEKGLVLLEKAEPVATHHQLTSRLSRLHHLRGNLFFSIGRADECRREHLLALEFAEQSESAEDEARALGGLGDAEYVRGRMQTARDHYMRCVELARQHGFGRIEVAHVGQRGWTRLYTGDCRGAKSDGMAAVNLAIRVGDRRAEMNGSLCAGDCALELGEYDLAETYAARTRTLAQALGARAWEPQPLTVKAIVKLVSGQQHEARELLTHALAITGEAGRAFQAARVLGTLAWVVKGDDVAREAALEEGENILREGVVSHNYFWFYRCAMDALIHVNDWDRVERYASALEDYTREEPLAWTDFFVARGRALAAFGRGQRDDATVQEIQRLRDDAKRLGLKTGMIALEEALSLS
jgi:tetratricopeptide (TPR) repeat protein